MFQLKPSVGERNIRQTVSIFYAIFVIVLVELQRFSINGLVFCFVVVVVIVVIQHYLLMCTGGEKRKRWMIRRRYDCVGDGAWLTIIENGRNETMR